MGQPFKHCFLSFCHVFFDVLRVNRQQIEFSLISHSVVDDSDTTPFTRSWPIPAQFLTAPGISYGIAVHVLSQEIHLELLESLIIQ